MGTIRFVLRTDKPNKDGYSPIQLIYQLSGVRKYYKTGEKLRPENWNTENQQALYLDKKTAKKLLPQAPYNFLPSNKEIEEINGNLQAIRKDLSDIENRFKLNKEVYSAEMVIDSLKENRTPLTKKKEQTNLVFDFIDQYIQDNKASREPASMCVFKSELNFIKPHFSKEIFHLHVC
jgi:hypothetical protein